MPAVWSSVDQLLQHESPGAAFVLAHQERRCVVMKDGKVGEEEKDSVLERLMEHGEGLGFLMKRLQFEPSQEAEAKVRLLEFRRAGQLEVKAGCERSKVWTEERNKSIKCDNKEHLLVDDKDKSVPEECTIK